MCSASTDGQNGVVTYGGDDSEVRKMAAPCTGVVTQDDIAFLQTVTQSMHLKYGSKVAYDKQQGV